MRIGELSRLTGVSARSLRYYEGLGLVRSTRTSGGWRDFDGAVIERVVQIQHLFAAGLCSATVMEILPCLDVPVDQRTGMLDERLADEVERLEASKREIERELSVLRALQKEKATLGG
jgi:DNA-binding transcriptional MerR regulator